MTTEELQAIVDRLPKTADSVPVVPGDTVYHKPEERGGYSEAGLVFLNCDDEWIVYPWESWIR